MGMLTALSRVSLFNPVLVLHEFSRHLNKVAFDMVKEQRPYRSSTSYAVRRGEYQCGRRYGDWCRN